jgi:hypothetical protein
VNGGRSVLVMALLGLALVLVGGFVAVMVLAHIIGRTRVAHPGWWAAHDDR